MITFFALLFAQLVFPAEDEHFSQTSTPSELFSAAVVFVQGFVVFSGCLSAALFSFPPYCAEHDEEECKNGL